MARPGPGLIDNPIRGFLNGAAGVGMVASGLPRLGGIGAPGPGRWAVVYVATGAVMFFSSMLYHSVHWSEEWKRRMRKVDHSAIFLFIAGAITPLAVIGLEGRPRMITVTTIWLGSLVGIVAKMKERQVSLGWSITAQNLIGWLGVIPLFRLVESVGTGFVLTFLFGCLLYLVGLAAFLTGRPVLYPGVFSSHELFHVMVVVATGIHFNLILGAVGAA